MAFSPLNIVTATLQLNTLASPPAKHLSRRFKLWFKQGFRGLILWLKRINGFIAKLPKKVRIAAVYGFRLIPFATQTHANPLRTTR